MRMHLSTPRPRCAVNDIFWVVRRAHAPPLFDHLQQLSQWGRGEQARQRQHQRGGAEGADALCGAAPRLRASPPCTDDRRHTTEAALACATGGHECMVSQAVSAQTRQWDADHPLAALRVRYLPEVRSSPQVLRLADTDARFCAGMQLAYLCSEKRKVRRAPAADAMAGSSAAAEAMAAAFAERQKRCKVADRTRVAVHTRTAALNSSRATSRHAGVTGRPRFSEQPSSSA